MVDELSRPPGDDVAAVVGLAMSTQVSALQAELGIARDALAEAERRREADRDRELVMRAELQHRVRNILALVRSIFVRTVSASTSMEDMAAHFEGRLDVLARYQVGRTIEPRGSADLEMVICDELQNFGAMADHRVSVSGPDVRLGYDAAQLVGLALHELATNSIKFGALSTSNKTTRIHLTWTVDTAAVTIAWEETGVAIVAEAPMHRGFGHTLILEALPYQLGARCDVVLSPGGLRVTMGVPLSGPVVAGGLGSPR